MSDITAISFEQISGVLSKLATNYSNLFIDYEKLFYDPIPQDVTVQIYDNNGELRTFTIPNRSKDRQFILNGEGSPEGIVFADKGSIYQDLLNGRLYIKQVEDDANGWYLLLSISELNDFIIKGDFAPEGAETAPLGTLFVNKSNGSLYVKTTSTGKDGWVLISADTDVLADKDLSNLSEEGEAHFANPSLNNLSIQGYQLLDSKEDKANKVLSLSEECTDTQYPSAKGVFDKVSELADRNLSNLTPEGEEHFFGKSQVRDCVLFAPEGGTQVSGDSLTLPRGTTLLGANGSDSNGGHIHSKKVTGSEASVTLEDIFPNERFVLLFKFQKGATTTDSLIYCNLDGYSRSEQAPTSSDVMVWYNPRTNIYKYTDDNGSTWEEYIMTEVAQFSTDDLGRITNLIPSYSASVALEYDLETLKNNTNLDIQETRSSIETMIQEETESRISEDRALRVKIDANSVSLKDIKENLITDYSSPSDSFTELTWEEDKVYTAPKDGWFSVVSGIIKGSCSIFNTATLLGNTYSGNFDSTVEGYCSLKVKKGQSVKVTIEGTTSVLNLRFIPAEGAK